MTAQVARHSASQPPTRHVGQYHGVVSRIRLPGHPTPADRDDTESIESWSTWESEFADGELGVTLGRALRWFGQLIITPFDNRGARRELRHALAVLEGLDDEGWRRLQKNKSAAEKYAVRLMDVIRCTPMHTTADDMFDSRCNPIYPLDIHTTAQQIIVYLLLLGRLTFDKVNVDKCFPDKTQFQQSVAHLRERYLRNAPKKLLLHLLSGSDEAGRHSEFLLEIRRQISQDHDRAQYSGCLMAPAIRLSEGPIEAAFAAITSESIPHHYLDSSARMELLFQLSDAGSDTVMWRMKAVGDGESVANFLARLYGYGWYACDKTSYLAPRITKLIAEILLCGDEVAESCMAEGLFNWKKQNHQKALPSPKFYSPDSSRAVHGYCENAREFLGVEVYRSLCERLESHRVKRSSFYSLYW